MPSTEISVIISSCNRVELLEKCLASLEAQSYHKNLFEVIVINDGSTDFTEQFLYRFKNSTRLNFKYISHENKGVSYSRNVGIDIADGQYIAFTDDDCIVPEYWLARMADAFSAAGPEIAGIGGPLNSEIGHNYITNFIHFADEFNYVPILGKFIITNCHISKLKEHASIAYLRTSNSVFRKQCLKQIGGFDINFKKPGGEDPDLCFRLLNLNYRFKIDKQLVVLHNNRDSFPSYFKSLKNYIRGEFRKNSKKKSYTNHVIRNSYVCLPGQKILSFLLSVSTAPYTFIKLARTKHYSSFQKITFPAFAIISKIYAFTISTYYQLLPKTTR